MMFLHGDISAEMFMYVSWEALHRANCPIIDLLRDVRLLTVSLQVFLILNTSMI